MGQANARMCAARRSRGVCVHALRPQAAGVRLGTTKLNRTDRGVERFDLTTDPMEKAPIRDRAAAGAAVACGGHDARVATRYEYWYSNTVLG